MSRWNLCSDKLGLLLSSSLMAPRLILAFLLLKLLIEASSTSTSDLSNPLDPTTNLSTPILLNCATGGVDQRPNVKAIDCLNLFTYILATEPDHTQLKTFGLQPGQRPGSVVFERRTGSCELFLVFSSGTRRPVAERTTLDTVLRVALEIVAGCFLDSRPDSTHWAGCAKYNQMSKLKICIAGPLPGGQNEGITNSTLSLDPGEDEWVDDLLES